MDLKVKGYNMSTDNKEKIIFGGFISILIILGLFILSTIILTCVYFCGFGMGWLMNLVIGVDGIVFGLTFPQLFGVLVTLTTMMAGSVGRFTYQVGGDAP